MNKVEEYSVEVWSGYGDEFGYFIPTDEIEQYVIPTIEPKRYFEIHKEYLADKYNIEEDELTMEDVDWESEQSELDDLNEYAVKLQDFDEEFAERMGYCMPTKSDLIFEAYHYLDSNNNWQTIWKESMDSSSLYRITKEYVSLDEWDGNNYRTGAKFEHEDVHRVIDTDEYIIVWHSQWQGSQPRVVAEGLSLHNALDYIANIDDNLERDLDYYKRNLLEL